DTLSQLCVFLLQSLYVCFQSLYVCIFRALAHIKLIGRKLIALECPKLSERLRRMKMETDAFGTSKRKKRKPPMNADDLKRFAEDLRTHLGLSTEVEIDAKPDGLHVLRINGVDFFFNADGSGYDGWGRSCADPDQPR
ncbi:MAG: hypothetical protein JXQ75_09520, partial [Phycisphaerae bacterium]|nr:hypothetical protein [Phycisphaerae bacterium]